MKISRGLGIGVDSLSEENLSGTIKYINLKLAAMGLPYFEGTDNEEITAAWDLIEQYKEKDRLLSTHLSAADQRIQNFLEKYFGGSDKISRLPTNTLELDKYGLARVLSIPPDSDKFETDIVKSYRIKQGVVHNPKNDRRTTVGSFHIVEGGLPVPFDKISVSKEAFAGILKAALNPPADLMQLPYTSTQDKKAETFVTLHLRPQVCPEVPGYIDEKALELRFFAPGNLVSNLDFVESIFGNAGDPLLSENDAALNPKNWTGHSGCVILAPHIIYLKKKDLGLPNIKDATERQIKDGQCWESEDELYNNGGAFKITCRDDSGVIVTIIGDNYFGYSKKEVKTQMGYSANLFGLAEEEHAGGALAYTAKNLGIKFKPDSTVSTSEKFVDSIKLVSDHAEIMPEGYAVDTNEPNLVYVPEDSLFSLEDGQSVSWNGGSISLIPENYYLLPSGYKVHMERHPNSPAWRLIGVDPEGTFCHKSCTVSGGGKSEISKSIWDAINFGPVFIGDFNEDMDGVQELLDYDYTNRFKAPRDKVHTARSILTNERSLGSVIRLLSPNDVYSAEYNEFVKNIPARIKSLTFLLKRFYRESWGTDWRKRFTVDFVNGQPGHEIRYHNRKLQALFLRIGRDSDSGIARTYKLRQDFIPAAKTQLEDDITASIVVPTKQLKKLNPMYSNPSVKMAKNSESRFFQRPDDAVIRGYDKQAEIDLSAPGNFISNFEPQEQEKAMDFINDTINFDRYTTPVKEMLREVADGNSPDYFIASSNPRMVNGAPTKNPRYLETQNDLLNPLVSYVHQTASRLSRGIASSEPLHNPVNAILTGRRNNPIDRANGIRPLAVFGPIHYQELPELYMDFICSLTGKSPSTTGAGSEGALTKGPFNALTATSDLNNSLLSYLLTGYAGFSSAAGFIGHKYNVAHDVSLLIPELWCRLTEEERDPEYLIKTGHLEKIEDFEVDGKNIMASRLGYRLTRKFTQDFLGKIFDSPSSIFPDDMLKPELQDMESYVDGILNITETHEKIAKEYIKNGSVEGAIPPLKALLYIMAEGSYEGKTITDPAIRALFTREAVLESDWYRSRLLKQQEKDVKYYESSVKYLNDFISDPEARDADTLAKVRNELSATEEKVKYVKSGKFLEDIQGTIGLDPLFRG